MSILDQLETTVIRPAKTLCEESGNAGTDIFNPGPYRYALYIGTDDNTFSLDVDTRSALMMLFGSYGDVRIARVKDDPESARRWKIKTYKTNEIVVMFSFFGNPMSQARMIRSLCIILTTVTTINHDALTIYRIFIKCDPTHRGELDVWWPPKSQIPEAAIKHIASRTSYADAKTREIEDIAVGWFHFERFTFNERDYYNRVKERLERFYKIEWKSWFFSY